MSSSRWSKDEGIDAAQELVLTHTLAEKTNLVQNLRSWSGALHPGLKGQGKCLFGWLAHGIGAKLKMIVL
jgi:hypothetical protein